MTTLTFRTDAETDRSLEHLTADGTSASEAIRAALIAADRARIAARLREESEELMNDPDDAAEMRAIREEMDAARAWCPPSASIRPPSRGARATRCALLRRGSE